MEIARAVTDEDLRACLAIREAVFIKEQAVSLEEEIDGKDPDCLHYIVRSAGRPVATARVLSMQCTAKIQRVAVLKEGRSAGTGSILMKYILNDLRTSGQFSDVVLGSQTHAIGFYENFGFVAFGAEYDDAGITHRDMKLQL